MKRILSYLLTGIISIVFFLSALKAEVIADGNVINSDAIAWEYYDSNIYNTTNGLMSNGVTSIAQSNDGIIWIGTDKGLVAFDGNEFTEYASFYYFDGVNDIITTKEGQMWYATTTYGPAVNLGKRFHHFDDLSEVSSNYATAIAESTDGVIYAGNIRYMVSIAPKDGFVVTDLSENGIMYVNSMAAGEENIVAGTTVNGDVFFMENGTVKEIFGNVFEGEAVVVYNQGYYIVGSSDGEIVIYDEENIHLGPVNSIESPLGTSGINNFYFEDNRMWILAEDAIGYYTFKDNSIEEMDFKSAVFSKCVFDDFESGYTDMMKDYQGDYWITSSKRGVLQLRSSYFMNEFAQLDLDNDVVNAVYADDSYLYAGTDSGMLIIDRQNNRLVENSITRILSGKRIVDIEFYKNKLVVGIYGEGVSVFDDEKRERILKEGLASLRINALHISEDILYILTDNGYSVWDGTEILYSAGEEQGLYNSKLNCVIEGRFGRQETSKLYLGSEGAGIYVLNNGLLEDIIDENSGLPSKNINAMAEYDKGFFIATDRGVCFYNGKKIIEFDNIPEELAESVCEDIYVYNNNLYIICEEALYVIAVEELFSQYVDEVRYTYLDDNTGFSDKFTASGHSYMANGIIYMPCQEKVYSISADFESALKKEDYKLKLRTVKYDSDSAEIFTISEEVMAEESSNMGSVSSYEVTVPSSTEELGIYCSVLEFSSDDPYVRYIMHGVDSEFTVVRHSELEDIIYEGLEGGSYTFWFQLLDSEEDADAVEMGKAAPETTGDAKKADEKVTDTIILTINKEKSFFENLWVRMLGLAGGFVVLMYFVFKDNKGLKR